MKTNLIPITEVHSNGSRRTSLSATETAAQQSALLHEENRRLMQICNACRYCEGFCAVFQAMSQRRQFSNPDLDYLSNLCHNCTACYHACQYAPPHDFDVNVPLKMAELRSDTYQRFAWPGPLAGLLNRNGLLMSLVTVLALSLMLIFSIWWQNPAVLFAEHTDPGAFYQIFSHNSIVWLAGSSFGFACFALLMGGVNSWRHFNLGKITLIDLFKASKHAALLTHLGGGHGKGCNTENEQFSNHRRWFHHFMAWGFMLCFAATSVATLYEYALGIMSPFPFFSLPVLLGTIGGIGLLIGPAGLVWLKLKSDSRVMHTKQFGMDYAFLALLFFISLTGLLLLGLRATSAMGVLLSVHLALVLALFVMLPYSKFVHSIYRFIALVKFVSEQHNQR